MTLVHAPRNVWATAQRGSYPTFDVADTAAAFAGRKIRLGAYGDPAALPIAWLDAVLADCTAVNGYTHQWRRFPDLAAYCMASVETASDRFAARLLGFRTFRVRLEGEPILVGEAGCQASDEAGHKTTCDKCLACGGHSSKAKADETLVAHGSPAKHYREWRASLAA